MASEPPAETRKKLEAAKKELAVNLAKKKKLDRDLVRFAVLAYSCLATR